MNDTLIFIRLSVYIYIWKCFNLLDEGEMS